MKLVLRKWVSGFLLSTIMMVIVPGEIIHHFAGHFDTEDAWYSHGERAVGVEHHHCEILKFQISEYIYQVCYDIRLSDIPDYRGAFLYNDPDLQFFFHNTDLRGPPCNRSAA